MSSLVKPAPLVALDDQAVPALLFTLHSILIVDLSLDLRDLRQLDEANALVLALRHVAHLQLIYWRVSITRVRRQITNRCEDL